MSKHLEFDEIVDFVFSSKIDDEYLKLAARVNSHIFSCEECRHDYYRVKDLADVLEKYRALESDQSVFDIIRQNMLQLFKVKIEDAKRIINISSKDFYYPNLAFGLSKSFGENDENDESIIMDKENNKIKISFEKDLEVSINKSLIGEKTLILLNNLTTGEKQIGKIIEDCDDYLRVEFENVMTGEYEIIA